MTEVTPHEIVAIIRLPTTTFGEAVELVKAYACAYASGEVIKAVEQQHNRTMAILEAPSVRPLT